MSQHETDRRITVLVCIAEPLLQTGVRASIAAEPDMDVIEADPDQRIVDVIVADSSSAAKLAERGQRPTSARILVIAAQAREHVVRSALEQGAHGFMQIDSPVCDLLAAVRTLARGRKYLCAPAVQQLAQVAKRDMLTSREDEVLRLLAKGLCNKSIARNLDIAVGTVKVHVKSILAKLDASSRTEAASIATGRGLVDVPGASLQRAKPHPFATAWRGSSLAQPSYA